MNLKPSLKSIADDKKVFETAALMLFGDEFVEKATDRVEKLKAFTKVATKPEQRSLPTIFWLPDPKLLFHVGPTLHAIYRSLGKISGWKYSWEKILW